MRWALVGMLIGAGTHWPARASAQSSVPIELSWEAVPGCPTKAAVLARARQIAGPTPATGASLRAEALITPQATGLLRLRLTTHSGDLVGVRSVDGKSCKDLAGVTAFWLAILLSSGEPPSDGDPTTPPTAETSEPESSAKSGAEAAKAVEPVPHVAPTHYAPQPAIDSSPKAAPPPRRLRGLIAIPFGAVSAGPMQELSKGLGVGAGISYEGWRVLAIGVLWSSQRRTSRPLLDEYGIDLDRFTLGLRPCRRVWGARFELAPCLAVSMQRLSARGTGSNIVTQSPKATWLSFGLGVQARLVVAPWLGVLLDVDGELETSRARIKLGGVGTLERLAPAAATIIVGAEWIL